MQVESESSVIDNKLKNHNNDTHQVSEAQAMKTSSSKRKVAGRRCLWATLGIIILIILVVVILAVTVFKPKHPAMHVDRLSLRDLSVGFDLPRLRVRLNVTIKADLTVHNPNKVGFKYKNAMALMNYRGKLVGEAPIPAGDISPGGTEAMNLSLSLMADRLLSNSHIYSDALSGAIPFNTYTKLSGKARILGIFKFHVVTSASCDVIVHLSNTSMSDQRCTYNTKL